MINRDPPTLCLLILWAFVVGPVLAVPQRWSGLFSSLGNHHASPSIPTLNKSGLDSKCLMCKFSVTLVNYALRTKRGHDQIDIIANNFCISAHLESPLVCSKVSKLFNHEVTKVLTYGVVTPDQVCGLLSNNTCGHFHSPLDDWQVHLRASQFIDRTQLDMAKQRPSILKQDSSDSYRVIHISDTHVDLNYAYGSPAVCEEPLCCQATSTPKNETLVDNRERAGYWGTYGFCDVPLRTFTATLKHLNETIEKSNDIEYIVWTGDIQPHDVWVQSQKSALQVYETIFKRIFKYLPSAILLPTFGNHEMVPVDSFSPSNLLKIAKDDAPDWLYKKFNAFWARWLPRDTEATITCDGFYAATVRPGLKVISLNTNFCHSRNYWLFINSTDPGNQLQWLVHELQMSELLHEKVHIIGHIPPGADDCLRVWSQNYHRIVERYASTVTGQFFGHTHYSEFEMFYSKVKTEADPKPKRSADFNESQQQNVVEAGAATSLTLKPFSVAQIGPSITTFIDVNPSYRIYTIDPKRDFLPVDFETFYVNLTQANQVGKAAPPEWHSAGSFSRKFKLPDISPQSMHTLLSRAALSLATLDSFEQDDGSDDDEIEESDTSRVNAGPSNNNIMAPSTARGFNQGDLIYELYEQFNSYSDKFNRTVYEKITLEDKKKFICRLLTGQSHDLSVCKQMIPSLDVPEISM